MSEGLIDADIRKAETLPSEFYTDEFFLVIEGTMFIEFESETMELSQGEMYVVPKGTKHRPYAHEECKVMLIEPSGVVNTGEAESELTASNDVWI